MTNWTLDQTQDVETRDLLVGHRIVKAEKGDFRVTRPEWRRNNAASGRLTLDDGTQVYVIPNEGSCACSAGDYFLTGLSEVDNIITDVRLAYDEGGYDKGYDNYRDSAYRIYVVADAQELNLLTVEGDDGNGYYGTGYELFVVPAEVAE